MDKSIKEFMEADHDRLDGIFKEFQNTKNSNFSNAKNNFHNFKIGLQRHIVWEEKILFPIFEEKTGMKDEGPTAAMRLDHIQIKGYLEDIHKKISSGDAKTDSYESGLLGVLSLHNEKEEGILYPWIDESISEKEVEDVFVKMQNLSPEEYSKCCGG